MIRFLVSRLHFPVSAQAVRVWVSVKKQATHWMLDIPAKIDVHRTAKLPA